MLGLLAPSSLEAGERGLRDAARASRSRQCYNPARATSTLRTRIIPDMQIQYERLSTPILVQAETVSRMNIPLCGPSSAEPRQHAPRPSRIVRPVRSPPSCHAQPGWASRRADPAQPSARPSRSRSASARARAAHAHNEAIRFRALGITDGRRCRVCRRCACLR